ncbi:MFS transporter [Kytococcus sedentarius]|nr:MFS transporter [Kytococcus sedentarius]
MTAITFITWIGTRMTAIALPLVALEETGEAWATGLVGGMAGLPLLTVGWWGRGILQRLTSGGPLAAVMGVNAVGLAVVPVVALHGQVTSATLCTSGLISGAAGALLGPAQRSLASDLADAHLAQGGRSGPAQWLAWQDLAHRVSMVFAPPLGAWGVSALGASSLLWCETVVIAAAALAFTLVPGAPATPGEDSANASPSGPPQRATSARTVLRAHPQIAAGVLMAGIGGLCWFGFSLGLAVLGVDHGRPGALIAAGMSGYGAASVIASMLVPLVIDRIPRMPTMLTAWAILGSVFIALPLVAPSLTSIVALAAVGGAAMPWGIAALNGVITDQTRGNERRAAFTAQTVFHSGGTSAGLLAGGALIGWLGAGTTLVLTGALQVLVAVGGALWALRTHPRRPSTPSASSGARV